MSWASISSRRNSENVPDLAVRRGFSRSRRSGILAPAFWPDARIARLAHLTPISAKNDETEQVAGFHAGGDVKAVERVVKEISRRKPPPRRRTAIADSCHRRSSPAQSAADKRRPGDAGPTVVNSEYHNTAVTADTTANRHGDGQRRFHELHDPLPTGRRFLAAFSALS